MARDEKPRLSLGDIRPAGREVTAVKWPGTDREVGLLLLRCAELQEAQFAAVEHFRRKVQPTDGVSYEDFLREKERQEVLRMLLQPGSLRAEDRLFRDADELRRELDLEEVAFFQREHVRLVRERMARLGLVQAEETKAS